MIRVQHLAFDGMDEDEMGNDVPTFRPAVRRDAYSRTEHRQEIRTGNAALGESGVSHTSRDIAEVDLTLPVIPLHLIDRFILDDGLTYETVGIRDPSHGWHGWKPGVIAELKRVTG